MIPSPEPESDQDSLLIGLAFPARIRCPQSAEDGLESLGCRWIPVTRSDTKKDENPYFSNHDGHHRMSLA
jgi:hypothetical protein